MSEKELGIFHLKMTKCRLISKSKGRDKSQSCCLFALPFAQGGRAAVCNRAGWEQRLVSYLLDRLSLTATKRVLESFPGGVTMTSGFTDTILLVFL